MNWKKGLINNNINKHKMKMVIFRERFLLPHPPSLPRCPYKGRGVISLARWQQRRQITWPTSDSLPVCDLLLQWNREKVSVSIFPYVSVFTGYWWNFWYFFMWMIVLLIRRVFCHLNRNGKQQGSVKLEEYYGLIFQEEKFTSICIDIEHEWKYLSYISVKLCSRF